MRDDVRCPAAGVGIRSCYNNTNWPFHHFYVAPTGHIQWPAVVSDNVAVMLAGSSGAGTATIAISTNGGAFGTVATVECNATSGVVFTNFPRTLARHALKVTSSGGIIEVIGPGLWNSTSNGLRTCLLYEPVSGLNISTQGVCLFKPPLANLHAISNFPPDLVLLQVKDVSQNISAAQYSYALTPLLERLWKVVSPTASVVYLGTAPSTKATYESAKQNTLTRAAAAACARGYWDTYARCPSVAEMSSQGWFEQNDGVHLTRAKNEYLGNQLARDLLAAVGFRTNASALSITNDSRKLGVP